ncbi:MAG: hypothetical protein JO057_28520 [Chloroflexi bacterium]|nr:hypothetical protein [Chloroflexota bacterium]
MHSEQRSKAEVLRVLRRLGLPEATIDDIGSKLSDPVDVDEMATVLQSYGLTRDQVVSRLGGSP